MFRHSCAAAAIAVAVGAAHAQSPSKPDVARPAASSAQDSAFAGYRPYRDEPLAPWREVNDEVGRVGGHSGALRADPKPTPAPPPRGGAPARDEAGKRP